MLTTYSGTINPSGPVWIDLLDPTEADRKEAEKLSGLALPTLAHISEIESSSRLRLRDGVLTVSTPMITLLDSAPRGLAPIGFVLSEAMLVTLRFSPLKAFDAVATQFDRSAQTPTCGLDVFVRLCDELVDRMADVLEGLAAELNALSGEIFGAEEPKGRMAPRVGVELRDHLKLVGRLGDRSSNTRDALLGLGRVLAFVGDQTRTWREGAFEDRIGGLRQDIASLNEYEMHLSDKVQFLLDALVGLIGMAQNEIFKVLTIVSIVGIPPTLMAGVYGMNFKVMPELSWPMGYPYGLAVIVLSAVLPAAWFKWRGWF